MRTRCAAWRAALSSRLPSTSARSVRSSGTCTSSAMCGSKVTRMPKGVRDSVARASARAAPARWNGVPVSDGAAHPGARQLAVDVAAHGVADRFDVLREGRFATFAQAGGIGRERRQRRLQPMGEIGGPAARSLDLPLLGVEQGVDLLDQRPTSAGTSAGRRRRRPDRISRYRGEARRAAAGRAPTWTDVAIASTRPSRPSAMARSWRRQRPLPRQRVKSAATATRTGTGRSPIVRNTLRSEISTWASAGPMPRDGGSRPATARRQAAAASYPTASASAEAGRSSADLPVEARERIGEARIGGRLGSRQGCPADRCRRPAINCLR